MTDEFKKKLFDYITGNYDIESNSDIPQFLQQEKIENNLLAYINNLGGNPQSKGILQLTNSKGEYLKNNIIYGTYNTPSKGFIVITDEYLNPLQTITTYYGGTELPSFTVLNIENGNIYGIYNDNTYSNLLMFTITIDIKNINQFKATFKKSYNISDNFNYQKIIKKPNIAEYIVAGVIEPLNPKLKVATIKVNVGSDNEIVIYTGTENLGNIQSSNVNIADLFSNWDGNFRVASITNDDTYIEYYLSSNVLANYTYTFSVYQYSPEIHSVKILNENYSYIISLNVDDFYLSREYDVINIYKLNKTNSTYSILYEKANFFPDYFNFYYFISNFKSINGEILFQFYYNLNSPAIPNNTIYDVFIGRIANDNVYIYNVIGEIYKMFLDTFIITKNYNLYNISVISGIYCYPILQVYNSANYNGLDYQALNSMIPESSILYDENDKIVFARNLYNKTINGGTTTSTVEVPNNYLNDINISKEELISETNSIMNSDTTLIEKNIYEQLYINFINKLNVIDNNTTTSVLNPTGASRINDSISQTMDYDDTKIVKFVINYSDDTSDIRNFCSKTYSLTENRCTYNCIIYVPTDKNISNIQIKSNDGNTTYLTINTSSLESGKFYRLSQDLVVE